MTIDEKITRIDHINHECQNALDALARVTQVIEIPNWHESDSEYSRIIRSIDSYRKNAMREVMLALEDDN